MTIEIGNSINLRHSASPNEDTKSGLAEKHSTQAQVETGAPVDSIQITENAQRLQSLQEAISSLPVVDTKKVEAAVSKIQNRTLDILGRAEQKLNSAEKIAEKLLALEQDFPSPNASE